MSRTFVTYPTDMVGRPAGPMRVVVHRSAKVDRAPVPEGSIAAVMAWVGYDPDRAKAALARELAKPDDNRRSSLVKRLTSRLGEA